MAALLAPAALLLFGAAPAAAELGEPVTLTPSAPEVVALNSPFRLEVEVKADAGALGIAVQPLRLRVRMAPECGGSFAGTEGPTAIDAELPSPAATRRYDVTRSARVTLSSRGSESVCAFLEDSEGRQFATDVETTVSVAPGCTAATRRLAQSRRQASEANRRLAELRRRQRHSRGAQRRALSRQVRAARKQRHVSVIRLHRARRLAKTACGAP